MFYKPFSTFSVSVLFKPCKANTFTPTLPNPTETPTPTPTTNPLLLKIELWRNDTYSAGFRQQLTNALGSYSDVSCAKLSSNDQSQRIMIFFNHDFSDDMTAILYGKNLNCEHKKCVKHPSVMLLHESSPTRCTDYRNPFCLRPSRCELVGIDTARNADGETGCRFRCKCNVNYCYDRFAIILDPTEVKAPGPLKLCGVKID